MKNILITGGSGFIGSEIVKRLYETREWDITVLDSMSEQIHGKNWQDSYLYKQIKDKCNFVKGSVTDRDTVISLVKDSDYIIHLAADTGTGQSMYQINQYNETNVMGTSNILQAISTLGKKKARLRRLSSLLLVLFTEKESMNVKNVGLFIQTVEQENA